MELKDYDVIIINSSAGKDSLCAIFEICRMADEQQFPRDKIVVSHQDLGRMEWEGTKELAKKQADLFGLKMYVTRRRDKNSKEETILEYALRRKKWPSNKQRWCTSDFKRGPGSRIVTMLAPEGKVLYVFGFRKEESPSRKKKLPFKRDKRLTTKKRTVDEYLPIHEWDMERVWHTIKTNNLPYHFAYDLGMPRLSCVFCIFSPFDALVVAGKANPKLLDEYIEVEEKIGHTFRDKFAIKEVRTAIENGYEPNNILDWVM